MNLLTRLTQIPLEELRDFDREMFLAAGLSPARVGELALVHSAYFGHGASKQTTAAAHEARLTVDLLAQIERSIGHVKRKGERDGYRFRLIQVAVDKASTCAALARYAKTIVPQKPKTRTKSARFIAPVNGIGGVVIMGDEHVMADLEAYTRTGINPDLPAGPQMAEAFEKLMRSREGVPAAAPRPLILVPAPHLSTIIHGHGDDIILGLTDGTTMTGAEFVNNYLCNEKYGLEAALFHPTEGPVNHYRERRLASAKQRVLAKATQPICTNPDCRMPADHCEIHHVEPWRYGGETNMNNLAVLCSYHNRVNDDDPDKHQRGRIAIRQGRPIWVSPTGYARSNKRHPYGAMESLYPELIHA